jgi:hypothetical protein
VPGASSVLGIQWLLFRWLWLRDMGKSSVSPALSLLLYNTAIPFL